MSKCSDDDVYTHLCLNRLYAYSSRSYNLAVPKTHEASVDAKNLLRGRPSVKLTLGCWLGLSPGYVGS